MVGGTVGFVKQSVTRRLCLRRDGRFARAGGSLDRPAIPVNNKAGGGN
jgi:hypothetical protein